MNVLIGDSRVLSIKKSPVAHKLSEVEDIWGKPGCTIRQCASLVEDNIIFHHPPIVQGYNHYYINVGICDITNRLRSKGYEEVIFNNDTTQAQMVMNDLDKLSQNVWDMGAMSVFCTIPTMHLQTWNEVRLKQKKTTTLNYQDQYSRMQTELD
jgi:hypothetical protein